MYTDQIGSPYASDSGDSQTTLGSQTRSQEAHYVHHFSINPKNLSAYVNQLLTEDEKKDNGKNSFQLLSLADVKKLKQAMAVATTYYDSTTKKDSENELLMWIEMNEGSEKILRNFTELIEISSRENGKTLINLKKVSGYLNKFENDISSISLYYDDEFTEVTDSPEIKGKTIEYKSLNDIFDKK